MAGFAPEVLAKLAAMGLYAPMGMGEKFFVNGFYGDNDHDGKTFQTPFKTIAHALDQCVDERGDYIFCFNVYQQETFPIHVDVVSVHIIGIAGPDGQWPLMVPTANTAIFNFPVSQGWNAEIAGFSLGAGAAHGCIELQGDNSMVWIHNCSFGHLWAVAGQDGVRYINGATTHGGIVEDCWFYGNAESAPGKLTRCGIICHHGWVTQATFRNNYFSKVPGMSAIESGEAGAVGGALYLQWADQCAIIHNKIGIADDTASGNGIYLNAGCNACLVAENEANRGIATDAKIPFVDKAAGDHNDWMCNQVGKANQDPVDSVA